MRSQCSAFKALLFFSVNQQQALGVVGDRQSTMASVGQAGTGDELQVVFRAAPNAPLVVASTAAGATLTLEPLDAARLSLHLRAKVGGPMPDRLVLEKVDDFTLTICLDRIEFASGSV